MKDFGKPQTNVSFTQLEHNQIPTSGPGPPKESNTTNDENSLLQQEQQKNKERILQLKKELQKQLKSTKLIDEQIHQQQIEDKKLEFPFMLVSSNAKDIIRDYKEGKEISGVPLDIRKYGKKVFDYHIKKNIKPKKQKKIIRTPLLCNHGISGSGKSVQQALNAHWFTDRFKNGVAIEITFNDDVEHLKLKSIKDTTQFESSC